ncbi:hypothetical protein [Thermocrinis sp.]
MAELYHGVFAGGKVILEKTPKLPDGTPVIVMTVEDAYLAGDISREEAITLLGEEKVAELDEVIAAIERDMRWGLGQEQR